MSNFSLQVNQPPIYSKLNEKDSNSLNSNWQKLFNQMTNLQNVTEGYGNPSVALNSDFYWNTGVVSPITSDGLISEEWGIYSNAGASGTYTITKESVPANDLDQTGSLYYLRVQIHTYTGAGDGADFYIYQRQTGNQFLRRYQNRNLSLSTRILNNLTDGFKVQLQYVPNYDPSTETLSANVISVDQTTGFYSTTVTTPSLSGKSVGAGASADFRLAIFGVGDVNLYYIKAEMCDKPTDLYIDHALEKTRIANS